MSNDSDFFDDVFEDPEDDPLLGGDSLPADEDSDEPEGPPSWMSNDTQMNGRTSAEPGDGLGPKRKQIVVDPRDGEGNGIDALNRAVGQGWRLVSLSLRRPDGEQASTQQAHQFVATIEEDNPQSLFDFG